MPINGNTECSMILAYKQCNAIIKKTFTIVEVMLVCMFTILWFLQLHMNVNILEHIEKSTFLYMNLNRYRSCI